MVIFLSFIFCIEVLMLFSFGSLEIIFELRLLSFIVQDNSNCVNSTHLDLLLNWIQVLLQYGNCIWLFFNYALETAYFPSNKACASVFISSLDTTIQALCTQPSLALHIMINWYASSYLFPYCIKSDQLLFFFFLVVSKKFE